MIDFSKESIINIIPLFLRAFLLVGGLIKTIFSFKKPKRTRRKSLYSGVDVNVAKGDFHFEIHLQR